MTKKRSRIDFLIEDALHEFAVWFEQDTKWLGKEHDCVNKFCHHYLAKRVSRNSAIKSLEQIRIEGGIPQPSKYPKQKSGKGKQKSARKDIVIWPTADATAWGDKFKPMYHPLVVMEWKWKDGGKPLLEFDDHDRRWLRRSVSTKNGTGRGWLFRVGLRVCGK